MPKKVKYSIKDQHTIILNESANENDFIDLSDKVNVDLNNIRQLIEEKKQELINEKISKIENDYQKKLEEEKEKFIKDCIIKNNEEISKLKSKINESEVIINGLKEQNKANIELQINEAVSKAIIEKDEVITKLKLACQQAVNDLNMANQQKIIDLQNLEKKLQENFSKERQSLQNENALIKDQNEKLTRERESLNVKLIGEELENWCFNEIQNHINSGGFPNTIFEKDNKAKSGELNQEKTKADFIFRVYADSKKSEEIVSVCIDAKAKSLNTKGSKNRDFYKKLDSDRTKNKCTYGLLVSELEMNQQNYNLIEKVQEYEHLYLIRPAYLVFFLQIIYNVAMQYSSMILEKKHEKLLFKKQEEITDKFNKFKDNTLLKNIENIIQIAISSLKEVEKINQSAHKLEELIQKGILDRINKMKENTEKFDIKEFAKKAEKSND